MRIDPNAKECALSGEEAVGVSSDSDCEIMEPQISVIDLNDSIEEREASVEEEDVAIIEEEREIVELDEEDEPACEINIIPMDESTCIKNSPVASPSNPQTPTNDTLLTVTFGDITKYDLLRDYVKDAIMKCLEEMSISTDISEQAETMTLNFVEHQTVDDLIFAVDTTPANKPEIGAIPSYRRSIREVFNDQKKKEVNEDECVTVKRISTCFNCSGSHAIRDCPEPRNQQRINKAKKAHISRSERYHVDIEQRFAHIKPGRISENLRRAMGLKSWELPPFVYNMRLLGYPPGWLEDAKVSHSGLTLFDSEGRQVQGSDDEDGELNEEKHKYDVRKIISFPGFNCDPEHGVVEDRRRPPRLPEDEKEKFIESLGGNIIKGYKRKKLKNLNAIDSEKSQESAEMVDMDIDADIAQPPPQPPVGPILLPYQSMYSIPPPPMQQPPLPPPDNPESPPQPPPEQLPPGSPPPPVQNSKKRRSSPTLEDLEAKQQALLKALENSATQIDTNNDDSLMNDILAMENDDEQNGDNDKLESPLTPNGDTQTTSISTQSVDSNTPQQTTPHSTPEIPDIPNRKSSVFGTPVIKFSPYDKLPTGEKFSVGVSDVINFENLPDSTGKYEQMVKVIEKVRLAVQRHNEEN